MLEDFDSYVGGDEVDPATFTPLATAKVKKLSDGNPMSGAYLNVSAEVRDKTGSGSSLGLCKS